MRRAELVKDFECVVYTNNMKCSWIPVNRFLRLTLSFRTCGRSDKRIKKLKKCDQPYSSGERDGCYLQTDATPDNVCMIVETETGMSTFKPATVVPSPEMNITEEGDTLKLRFTVPTFKRSCWIYEVCYKQCGRPQNCQNVTFYEVPTMEVPYDKTCLYEFKSRVMSTEHCIKISSNFSAAEYYGTNVPHIGTVVAIVIPVILSICVILSCSCFRRHSAIICPAVPDPSAIFKEMMMNGNKERLTTKGSLYTPVPEPIESCKITLVTDKNSILQQNC
ncbi:interleukin-13 receptor subunit alpha-1-like [Pempheris klunzingeri]|uniref:interleukin-13 receptor subunit alpha-1-like n=1 Tax=Pempheris klunzingeri TaxID=3127111 RepID=UPI0039800681